LDHFESFNRKRGFDATAITHTIKRALASAGLDTSNGPLAQVTGTIEQALSAAGLMPGKAPVSLGTTFDGTARVVDPEDVPAVEFPGPAARNVEPATQDTPSPQPGEFLERSFTSAI